jgi:hypothetical protein
VLPRLSPRVRVPLDDVRDGKAWVAYEFGDEPLDSASSTTPISMDEVLEYFWNHSDALEALEPSE